MFGSKFWETAAESVAQKWGERLFSPALFFWALGVVLAGTRAGWGPMLAWLQARSEALYVALAVGSLIVVVGSAALVEGMQLAALRWLEGYWPRWLAPLSRLGRAWQARQVRSLRERYTALARRYDHLSPEEQAEYARLDAELHTYPDESRLLPTRLGNLLRAAEEYGYRRYRLATGVIWPRLWLVLPDETREEITAARARMDGAVRLVIWSVLLAVWTLLAWGMPWWVCCGLAAVAALGGCLACRRLGRMAGLYGDLLRAAVDVHRFALYQALHLPLPASPAEERLVGEQATMWLWRGRSGGVRYTHT
ncbi:MAG: hypothetical protein DRH24_17215 [Deltaproteobacteria bacterium]|nr:MAG: hypothetical protein DRH24_17215 [Deltaproteobacteria bacterium]